MAPSKSSWPDRGRRSALLDAAARAIGRRRTLVLMVAGILLWITLNTVVPRAAAVDPPPFPWLKRSCLLLTTVFLFLAHRGALEREARRERQKRERLALMERELLRELLEGGAPQAEATRERGQTGVDRGDGILH